MENAFDSQALGHLNEHGPIIDINDLLGAYLRNVQGNMVKVRIRLAVMHEAGGYEEVNEAAQFKLLDAVNRQLAPFITDGGNLETVLISSLPTISIISGKGRDWANMNALNSSLEKVRFW